MENKAIYAPYLVLRLFRVANVGNCAWLSTQAVMDDTGLSRAVVVSLLNELTRKKVLERTKCSNQNRRYRLTCSTTKI